MTKKLAANKKVTSLVERSAKTQITNLNDCVRSFSEAFAGVSTVLSGPIAPKVAGAALSAMREVAKISADIEKVAKGRVLELVTHKGEVVTDKGTRRYVEDGYVFEARPSRSGTDPKKLEALFRAKGLDPERGMDTVITYKVSEHKLFHAIERGDLTTAEVEACKYEESWTVLTPKQEQNDE